MIVNMNVSMIAKKIAKKVVLALTLAAVVAAISATVPRAQSNEPPTKQEQEAGPQVSSNGKCDRPCQLRERLARQLEGSWVIAVTAVVPPGAPAPPVRTNYTTFARGGGAIGSDRLAPFANPQHGAWEHRGGNEFAWTFVGDNFDATGNYLGTLKVSFKINLTGPDTFVGVDNAELRDAAGNLVLNRCNTVRGQRIKIEPLAEACQSITPPQ